MIAKENWGPSQSKKIKGLAVDTRILFSRREGGY